MREINWKSKPQELLLWYLKEEEEVENENDFNNE